MTHVERLELEDKIRKALIFYANGDNWESKSGNPSAIHQDGGRVAREAYFLLSRSV